MLIILRAFKNVQKLVNFEFMFAIMLSLIFVSCEKSESAIEEPVQKRGYTNIPKQFLEGWDDGIITMDKSYFVVKKDTVENEYICYMNDSVNSTAGLVMYLDADLNFKKMVFEEGTLLVEDRPDSEGKYVCFVDTAGNVKSEENIQKSFQTINNIPNSTRAVPHWVIALFNASINAYDAYGKYCLIGTAATGNWDLFFQNLTSDAIAGIFGFAIGGVPGAVISIGLTELFNAIITANEKQDLEAPGIFLGQTNAEIVDIQRTGVYTYMVKVNVTGMATRPLMQASKKRAEVKVGIYYRKNFSAINGQYKDGESNMYQIDGNGTIEIPLTFEEANATYFIATVLLPYFPSSSGGSYNFKSFRRYGESTVVNKEFPLNIESVNPRNCTRHSDSKNYTFDVEISSSIFTVKQIKSWGVELYA